MNYYLSIKVKVSSLKHDEEEPIKGFHGHVFRYKLIKVDSKGSPKPPTNDDIDIYANSVLEHYKITSLSISSYEMIVIFPNGDAICHNLLLDNRKFKTVIL